MATIPKKMLKWRNKRKEGSIMKPSTVKSIESKAAASGATDPKAVAWSAYWKTLKAKYRNSKKKK